MMNYNQQNKAYKLVKRYFSEKKSQCTHIKDKKRNLPIDETAIARRWKEYEEELYGDEDNTDSLIGNLVDDVFVSSTRILKLEFEDALQAMKKNRAPGADNLTAELLQQTGDEIKNILISTNIEARLANDQYGFRKNEGTREAISGLRIILEKQIERQKITHMAFVDLEKTFDSINWACLFKILEESEIDFRDRCILHKLYEEQKVIININSTISTAKVQKGNADFRKLRETYGPHDRPTEHTIRYTIVKFEIQFSLLDNTRPNRPHPTRNEENIAAVAGKVRGDRDESIRRRSQQLGLSDEAHSWLNGYINKQNCRIWAEEQPKEVQELPSHPDKIIVWCGL
ncbi:Reverse transcriptase domain [Cinara cedri]|uniref:Reverse transcriptase domain n=1 Tax=Cinara cedri TaxID=506608 RepID=A0A5E4LZ32_9HEMI|nr:Reverse transcriptase domain [Cinara cedri]